MGFEKEFMLVQRWLDETDAIAMQHFRIDALAEIKDDGTPVTAGDRDVERALRRHLEDAFPADAIVGEEEGTTGEASRRWIIDPIDGTSNYARGVPVFATLVALEVDGVTQIGVVSAPALATRWGAVRGEGASCNGAPITVSRISSLPHGQVCWGDPTWAHRAGWGHKLGTWGARERAFADFWGHVLVAQGSFEVMLEPAAIAEWDLAAPKIIVEEAGGRVTDADGNADIVRGPVISTNGLLHDEVLRALR